MYGAAVVLESASDGRSVCVGNAVPLASEVACDKLAISEDVAELLLLIGGMAEIE